MPFKTNALACCCAVLLLLVSTSLSAQKTVSGRVTSNADKQPIAGATVQVKGTKIATQTGADGTFSLTSPNDIGTLIVTVVGFEALQIPVVGRSSVGDVVLSLSATSLNDVVVTGYTAQKKKDITGSVAVVNVANMKSVPGGNTDALLQGQASGVTVISSGSPGGYSNIRIRGITSLGSSDPLIIVDGVQGNLKDLDPNNIESVQILKDAGAAAIYGIQGSNGVIIVTTKRGRSGKARVTYDGYVGVQQPLKDGFRLANTQEYANTIWAQAKNSGAAPSNAQFGTGPTPVIPDYITPAGAKEGDPGTDPSTYLLDPTTTDNQITKANKAGTDWFHEIFKPAIMQSHTVTVSGGADKSAYLFSVNYLDQQGTLMNTYLKRYSARINTQFNVKDNIRIGENAYVFYKQNPGFTNQNEGNAISMTYREPPIIPVYDIKGNFAGSRSKGLSNAQNPVAIMKRTADNKSNDWQVNGNVFAEVDFLKHFTARTSFGGSFDNYYYYYFTYTGYENAEGNTSANGFTEGSGYNSLWQWTNTLNYSNIWGKHNLKVLVGSEAKDVYQRGYSASRSNYYTTSPNFWILNTGSPSTAGNNGGSPYQLSLFSLFARADYSYDERYLLSATVRRDQASVFDPAHNTGYFPSFTLGWRLSREAFMQNVSWINDLKLRGGWGKLGSISNINATNPYSLYQSSAGTSYYPITGSSSAATQGFNLQQYGNTATTWESDIVTNIGLDATIIRNKLDFSVEWYRKKISGLLYQLKFQTGALVGGAAPPYVNAGDIQNTGIDFSATYHATAGKDWKIDVTGNLSAYKTEIVSLPPGYKYVDQYSAGSSRIGAFVRTQPGQAIGAFYGYKVVGLFRDQDDVNKSPTQDGKAPGRFKYADINHDGKITDSDRTFFGNPNPKFTYGINLAVSYKAFDFSAFFYGVYGNDVINYVKYWTDFPQVFGGNVSKEAATNSWTPTNLGAKIPILEQSANFSNTTVFNSYYMEKGSYFRCKQMQIGYTISPTSLHKAGIDRLRVYLQAANLFTITKYDGLDPELQGSDQYNNTNFGIDFGNYPANQKTFLIGVNLTF